MLVASSIWSRKYESRKSEAPFHTLDNFDKNWKKIILKIEFCSIFSQTSGNLWQNTLFLKKFTKWKKITQQKNDGPKFLGAGCVTYGPWGLEMLLWYAMQFSLKVYSVNLSMKEGRDEINWTRTGMLQIMFVLSLESSWQGGVHGLGFMRFILAVLKFLNSEWFLHWKFK
jgi:hypothetical protein